MDRQRNLTGTWQQCIHATQHNSRNPTVDRLGRAIDHVEGDCLNAYVMSAFLRQLYSTQSSDVSTTAFRGD